MLNRTPQMNKFIQVKLRAAEETCKKDFSSPQEKGLFSRATFSHPTSQKPLKMVGFVGAQSKRLDTLKASGCAHFLLPGSDQGAKPTPRSAIIKFLNTALEVRQSERAAI